MNKLDELKEELRQSIPKDFKGADILYDNYCRAIDEAVAIGRQESNESWEAVYNKQGEVVKKLKQEVNYWKTESQTRLTHIADKCYEIKKLKQERLEPISEWDFKMMLFNLFPHSYGDDGECQLKPKHGFYIDGNLIAKEAVKRFGTRPIPSVEEIRKILTEEFGTIFPKHSEDYINNEVAIFIHKLMEGE